MEKLEKFKNQTDDIVETAFLSDGKTVEMRFEPGNEKIKEYVIRDQNGNIVKFADLNFNKELYETLKNSCLQRGIILKNEEIEKLAEKKADALLIAIDEDKAMEN